jgi:dTDP-glucose 4,6-dehydratase
VGTGDERSVDQIADTVLEVLEKPATLKSYVDDRPGHDRRYLLDHSKITRELGWRPEIEFANGIRSTIGWYAKNEEWWRRKKAQVPDEFAWQAAGRR